MRNNKARNFAKWVWLCLAIIVATYDSHSQAAEKENAGSRSFTYLSLGGKKKAIAVYQMSDEDGSLKPVVEQPLEQPGPLTLDAKRRRLYAVNYPDKIHTYEIDPDSGHLKSLGQIRLPGQPEYISLDRDSQYLMAAIYSKHQIVVCRLDKQGIPQTDQLQTLDSGRLPHSILADRHNRFVYVPCKGSNQIFQYAWDENGKGLLPKSVARHATPKGAGPRHLWFHPNKDWLYVVNESDRTLAFYRIAPDDGALHPVQTVATVPEGVLKGSGAHIQLTPNGRFVYSSNRGEETIAGFAIDQKSGELKSLGQSATARGPRAFCIDPSGRFLLAGGTSDGRVVVHAIDQESGQTKMKQSYETGGSPVWIEIISFKRGS